MKKSKELTVDMPWGKLAMITWGDPSYPPVLLMHGYMDSAATYILLMEHLPDNFYYVAIDLPGHGKSDPFPPGPIITQLHMVEVLKIFVDQMKWDNFIFIGHSMATVIGSFYNYLYPGKMSKLIFSDPGPGIGVYFYVEKTTGLWMNSIHMSYYENYKRFNFEESRHYTYDEALNLIMKNRKLTPDQTKVLLSRVLIPAGDGLYKFTWDMRMKKISHIHMPKESVYTIMEPKVPTLALVATINRTRDEMKAYAAEYLRSSNPNLIAVDVEGGHDVHVTNPKDSARHIIDFLNNSAIKSKL